MEFIVIKTLQLFRGSNPCRKKQVGRSKEKRFIRCKYLNQHQLNLAYGWILPTHVEHEVGNPQYLSLIKIRVTLLLVSLGHDSFQTNPLLHDILHVHFT